MAGTAIRAGHVRRYTLVAPQTGDNPMYVVDTLPQIALAVVDGRCWYSSRR
ncbi:hypothetical protein V6V47_03040 [Micromonospora sp. CPCC 205539]|uniref:hypothetical protein n=1 Tax=Micromonospora sp. CPCC 205539 TaxID=3122408 RepID=UPI002FF1A431